MTGLARRWLVMLPLTTTVTYCSHQDVPKPTAEPTFLNQQQPLGDSFFAEFQAIHFGPQGRLRTTGTLYIKRPHFLRVEVSGTPMGLIYAFAATKDEFFALNMSETTFITGPAYPGNLNRILGQVPLNLGPAQWVELLLGRIALQQDGQWFEQGNEYLFQNTEGSTTLRAFFGHDDLLLNKLITTHHGADIWIAEIVERTKENLPSAIVFRWPAKKMSLRLFLSDWSEGSVLQEEDFALEAPANFKQLRVDAEGKQHGQ
jgi:hypothetical protein